MKKRVLLKDSQNNELYPRPCMPIGSVIFLNNTLDPNTYFMGTWQKIEEEVFFMTSSSSYPVGQVSGSNEKTISIGQIPNHYHTFLKGDNVTGAGNRVMTGYGGTVQGDVDIFSSSAGGGQPFDVRPRRYAINAWVRIS